MLGIKDKTIYIILSHTGTLLSTLIHVYTRDEFSHVSIALDKELSHMYSFGRLHAYNPFIAGFIHEGITFGTFNRFKDTQVEIYALKITSKQYKLMEKEIYRIRDSKTTYKFNIIGLFATGFNLKYREKNAFYCAEFVKHILDEAKVDLNLPELVKPIDFKYNDKTILIYKGLLRKYKI